MTISQLREIMTLSHEHDSFHGLIDVASEVPVLLEQSDLLIASRNIIPLHLWENVFDSSLLVLEKLHEYHESLKSETQRALYWAVPSRAHNPADDPYDHRLFPFALEFASLEIASQVVFWWAIVVHVLSSIIDLHEQFFGDALLEQKSSTIPEPRFNSRFPSISSIREEADRLTRYLCQSIEYCYKTENGTIGPQMTTYAQWVLGSYFRKYHLERELAWCLSIKNMKGPGFLHGIELMGFHDGQLLF